MRGREKWRIGETRDTENRNERKNGRRKTEQKMVR